MNPTTAASRPSGASAQKSTPSTVRYPYHVDPNRGCYMTDENGKRQYVDKSKCK